MTPLVQNVTDFLSFGTLVADVIAVLLIALLVTPLKNTPWGKSAYGFFHRNSLWLGCAVATASIFASLFYSEIAGFLPCLLCWWDRILLYPQALILFIAALAKESTIRKYCLTLSCVGILLATYHTYLQFGGTAIGPCSIDGASCERVYFLQYGYVTIPTMALTAFALIFLFMMLKKRD